MGDQNTRSGTTTSRHALNVEFGDERFVATEVSDPDEYARLYALAEHVYAGYADYRAKTVAIGRQIPIFRLKPG